MIFIFKEFIFSLLYHSHYKLNTMNIKVHLVYIFLGLFRPWEPTSHPVSNLPIHVTPKRTNRGRPISRQSQELVHSLYKFFGGNSTRGSVSLVSDALGFHRNTVSGNTL